MNLFTQNPENQEVTEIISSNTSATTTDNQVVTANTIKSLLLNDSDKLDIKLTNLKYNYLEERTYTICLMKHNDKKYYTLREKTDFYSSGLSINKFGSKYITLVDYNLLGTKTTEKISYSDITIIK